MAVLRRIILIAATVSAVVVGSAEAQNTILRDGFYSTIGIGFGSAKFSCDQCDGGRQSGVSGLFAIGTAIDQPIIIGVELDFFYKSQDFEDGWIATVTAFGQWYPASTGPFFVKGGLGLGSTKVTFETQTGGFDSRSKSGFGYMVAVGYDWRIGSALSLTPLVGWYGGSLGDADDITGLNVNVIQAILTIGFF
jgi:hypothetical protein